MRAVRKIELPELHKDGAARLRSRRMPQLRRIVYIGSRRKIAGFVLKHAVENQKLLAALMNMRREAAPRCKPHNRRRPRDLLAQPIEHPPLYAWHRQLLPRNPRSVHGGTLVEIRIQIHDRFPPPKLRR